MNFSLKNSRGFTLIELLVVIAIIGLLSSVVLASLNSARGKARDARRLADLQEVVKALDLYYDDHGKYPTPVNYCSAWYHTWSGWDSNSCGDTTSPGLVIASDNGVAPYLRGYIGAVQDPLFDKNSRPSQTYYYCSSRSICTVVSNMGGSDGDHYMLAAYLENPPAAVMAASLKDIFVGTTYCGQNNFYCIGK